MNSAIEPGGMKGTVKVPASKSYANRALILAALRPEALLIKNMPHASDVTNLISALTQIGLRFQSTEDGLLVSGSYPECETNEKILEVGEGGTTARFLAVLLLKGKKKYLLRLGQRLKNRPWQEFIDLACSLGAHAELTGDVLSVQGPLGANGEISVDCTRTTQFFTAFQLVFGEERAVIGKHLRSSQSYVAMTEKMIRDFKSASEFIVPSDWSSASYPLAFAALNGGADFPGLRFDPFQADAKFYDVLKQNGFLSDTSTGVCVQAITREFSLQLDVSDCLDLVPTLVYFLSHIPGHHTLNGVSNLRHKESDRLSECSKLLQIFERKGEVRGDSLVIEGRVGRVQEKREISLPDDHRMVMAATLFLRHHSGGTISPTEAVEKSYPDFFELFPR